MLNIHDIFRSTDIKKSDLIKQYFPHIIKLLKTDISKLTEQELNELIKSAGFEVEAKELLEAFVKDLLSFVKLFSHDKLAQSLRNLSLSEQGIHEICNIFKNTLLSAANITANKLLTGMQTAEETLYGSILTRQTGDILESILNFKTQIDKKFPGASDQIIKALGPALVTLVSAYSPILGSVLKYSGVVKTISNNLNTANLEKYLELIRHNLEKIEQDKQLKLITEIGKTISVISDVTGISKEILNQFSLSQEQAKDALKNVETNTEAKDFLIEAAKFAKQILPFNQEQISSKLGKIKDNMLQSLNKAGLPNNLIKDIEKILNNDIESATKEMIKTVNSKEKIFTKLASTISATEQLQEAVKEINKIADKSQTYSEIIKKSTALLSENIKNNISPDSTSLVSKMTADSKAIDFAKNILGVSISNEIIIRKQSNPQKAVNRSFAKAFR